MERRRLDHEVFTQVQVEYAHRASWCVTFNALHCLSQIFYLAHEAAVHAAKLRVELSQSKAEQQEYLKNVELARVLDKRAERKGAPVPFKQSEKRSATEDETRRKKRRMEDQSEINTRNPELDKMLNSVF